MIIIKYGIKEKFREWNDNDIYILTDFDRTITTGNSNSSWGILTAQNFDKNYEKERKDLYNFYRPLEVDSNINLEDKSKLMEEWWTKHINLFIKYKMNDDVIKNTILRDDVMSFRKNAKDFLIKMNEKHIPVIIISAGIGNVIKEFLKKENCYFENIYIISNYLNFENGIAAGIEGKIIHSFNKNEISLTKEIKDITKNRKNVIVLGDTIGDSFMYQGDNDTIKIAFLEENVEENLNNFKNYFDIVCTNNTSYKELFDALKND